MTDPTPGAAPVAAPLDIVGAAKTLAPYALALGCLGAVVFDAGLSASADTALKLLLGAALMAINPSVKQSV